MTIPEIRTRLHFIGQRLAMPMVNAEERHALAGELHLLAEETRRRRCKKPRGTPKSRRLTDEDKAVIKEIIAREPFIHETEVAAMFMTNPGRVSETIQGSIRR